MYVCLFLQNTFAKIIGMDKKKVVKTLRLLFIGELFTITSFLGELQFAFGPLLYLSLFSLIGMIIVLVSVIKLYRANKFFLLSFLCVCLSLLIGITGAVLTMTNVKPEILATFDFYTKILAKGVNMAFIFGIIRGCSKAALGKANTKYANIMSIVNTVGKGLSILLLIISGFIQSNETAIVALSVTSVVLSFIVEVFFIVYVYRAYKMSKEDLKEKTV